jgi:protein O-mannosyl-transferase
VESTLIPLELAFEHRNDLPSLGLILTVTDLIGSATGALARFRPVIAALGLLALFSLGLARSWVWGNAEQI